MALLDLLNLQRERGEDSPIKLSQIADRQNISLSYLEQLFAQLRRAELVSSVRGPGGGYVLAKPAYDTWLGDIVKAVDEPMNVTRCGNSASKSGCTGEQNVKCNAHYLWVALGDCVASFMNQLSLEMVINNDFGDFTPEELMKPQKTVVQIA